MKFFALALLTLVASIAQAGTAPPISVMQLYGGPTNGIVQTTGGVLGALNCGSNSSYVPTWNVSGYFECAAGGGGGSGMNQLTGDVTAGPGTGSQVATVASVGGSTASAVNTATVAANAATNLNTNSAIVKRDGSGNFSATTITAALSGNASTASAFAANPADCSANQYATTIAANGDLTCAQPAYTSLTGQLSFTAPLVNTAGTVTCSDASGSAKGCITAADWTSFNGKQASGSYLTALTGGVTASGPGSAAATVVSVGGSTASAVNTATVLANAATDLDTNSAIVKRDGSGNFSATTITAALTGNASTATALAANPTDCSANQFANAIVANGNLTCAQPTYSNLSGSVPALTALTGDVTASGTGSQAATVAAVGGSTASAVNTATVAANAATNLNTISTIVKRDGSGNFTAGTITAALTGNASTASALAANPSDCSANQYATTIAANGDLTCAQPAYTSLTGQLSFTAPLVNTAGTVDCTSASGSVKGCLTSTDWTTFNGKQASGNYITALTGDVTASGPGSVGATIAAGAVDNSKVSASAAIAYSKLSLAASIANSDLATMATQTFKGRTTAGTGAPQDLTVTQATALLNSMVGDSGSGGVKGLVPAPATGDATKVLSGAGTWISAGSGTVTSVAMTVPTALFASSPVSGSPVTTSGTLAPTLATQTAQTFFSGPSSGSAATPTFKALTAPTIQKFLTTGTTTGYLFTVSSANATVGATYTNNGNTYTVLGTISAGTQLFCSQASAPAASGTLTKASGTGDATITFSSNLATATYTTPTNPAPLYLRVREVAGGGGGGGNSSASVNGGSSYFGPNMISAGGGVGGQNISTGVGGAGGSATINSSATVLEIAAISGAAGQGATLSSSPAVAPGGGNGGSSFFGGAGAGGPGAGTGGSAATSSGSGGGGIGGSTTTNGGGGGGSGAFAEAIIASPSATYPYAVGAGGAGAASGGIGGGGRIEITEYYQ